MIRKVLEDQFQAITFELTNLKHHGFMAELEIDIRSQLQLSCGFLRRQELRELRLLQKEEQRAQQQLSNKLQQQREQIFRRFEQETTVSQFGHSSVVSFLFQFR